MRSAIFSLGGSQVAITAAILAVIAVLFGLNWQTALFIGLALALSSTAFALQVLEESGDLNTRHGRLAFAELFRKARPAIRLANQSEVQVGTYSGPVYRAMRHGWQTLPDPTSATTAP